MFGLAPSIVAFMPLSLLRLQSLREFVLIQSCMISQKFYNPLMLLWNLYRENSSNWGYLFSFQTLQHLVWILGLKPMTGGALTTSGSSGTENSSVITTAVMADLPVLSNMVTRLFESSTELSDISVKYLIEALCRLSDESIELASSNREPSLFAVAKLLETALVNLGR